MNATFVRMRSGDHLGDAGFMFEKVCTSLRRNLTFLTKLRFDRNLFSPESSQRNSEVADLQNVASDFLIFALGT